MKKFLGLLQNELIKIWKQTGYRVMLFILVGISLLTPLLGLFTTINFDLTAQEEYDDYMSIAEQESGVYRYYFTALAETKLFFIDNKLDDNWKYKYFAVDYEKIYLRAYATQLIETGKIPAEEIEKSPFDGYFYAPSYSEGTETGEYEYKYDIPSYDEAKAELDAFEKRILSTTEKDVSLDQLEQSKVLLEEAKATFATAEQLYNADRSSSELEYAFKTAKVRLEATKMRLEAWQAIYDHSAAPDSWAYSMAYLLVQTLDMRTYYIAMPEDMYEDNNYDAYLKSCEKNYEYYNEAASVYLHSIKTNNCLSPLSNDSMLTGLLTGSGSFGVSTKTQLRSAINSFISLVTILMVVLASGIISTEFSSGTIRLLVIRPCSRRQIIASKLTAVGLIYIVLVALMSVVFTIETVLMFGIGDLFAPDIFCIAGNIIDLPFFVLTFERIAVASLAALAYVGIAVMLASLTRKNGLAIVMSMLVYAFGSAISSVVILLAQVFPDALGWTVYTPLAYMSLTTIVPPAYEVMSMTGLVSDAMLWLGVLYHIVFIVGMLYLTVLTFRKKQIKN